MNCQQATKYIWDFCDNRLSLSLAQTLEAHCAECNSCRQHLELTRLENEVLRQVDNQPVLSLDFTDRVMKNLTIETSGANLVRKDSRKRIVSHGWLGASSALLGTLLLLLVLPGLIYKQTPYMPTHTQQPPFLGGQSNAGQQNGAPTPSQATNTANSKSAAGSQQVQADTQAQEHSSSESQDSTSPRSGSPGQESNPVSRSFTAPTAMSTPKLEDINDFPFPISFPQDYQLAKINSTADNSVDFQFTKTGSNTVVDVMVTRLDDQAPTSQAPMTNNSQKSISNFSSTTAGPDTVNKEGSPTVTPSNSELSWPIEEENQAYRVTMNGNLSPQDLAQFAGTMKFQIRK